MSLRHRLLGAIQTIEDEFTEKSKADLTGYLQMLFAVLIGTLPSTLPCAAL